MIIITEWIGLDIKWSLCVVKPTALLLDVVPHFEAPGNAIVSQDAILMLHELLEPGILSDGALPLWLFVCLLLLQARLSPGEAPRRRAEQHLREGHPARAWLHVHGRGRPTSRPGGFVDGEFASYFGVGRVHAHCARLAAQLLGFPQNVGIEIGTDRGSLRHPAITLSLLL